MATETAIPTGDAMHRVLAEARRRRRTLDRAAAVAAFNGWTAAALAILCVPFALFSVSSLVAAVVLGIAAYVELAGRRMLRRLDDAAPGVLAVNQLAFGAVVILYAAWRLYLAATGRGYAAQYQAEFAAQVPDLNLDDLVALFRTAEYAVYGLLVAGTVLMQGLTALYYWTRRAPLRAFVRDTPPWAVDVLRAAA